MRAPATPIRTRRASARARPHAARRGSLSGAILAGGFRRPAPSEQLARGAELGVSNTNTHAARTRTGTHEAAGVVNPGRLFVLLPGQVASPECVCDEMPRPDRRGYGEANKDDKIKIIDVLDAEPVE
jgi:hypothetical protein